MLLMAAESTYVDGTYAMRIPIIRRLIEKGVPLELSVAKKILLSPCHVEITRWLQESDRAQLVLDTMKNGNERFVWWWLVHTNIEEEALKIKNSRCYPRDDTSHAQMVEGNNL